MGIPGICFHRPIKRSLLKGGCRHTRVYIYVGRDDKAESFRAMAKVLEERGKKERATQAKYIQPPDRGEPVVTRRGT